ncbi:Sulfotransferase domain [Trinorchestia longiramus]|nr:Sulfotransferase domain [Trinorchestia longiramus]
MQQYRLQDPSKAIVNDVVNKILLSICLFQQVTTSRLTREVVRLCAESVPGNRLVVFYLYFVSPTYKSVKEPSAFYRMAKKRRSFQFLLLVAFLGIFVVHLKTQKPLGKAEYDLDESSHWSLDSASSSSLSGRKRNDHDGSKKGFNYKKLSIYEEKVLEEMEQRLQRELQNYSFHPSVGVKNVTQLIFAHGGRPLVNLVVATWRSGSTFVGDLLDAHPATIYQYEPLLDFGIIRPKHGHLAHTAQRYLNQLLTCNYTQMERYIEYGKTHSWLFSHSKRLWSVCSESRKLCESSEFLSRFCALFPFQVVKTVRIPMNLTEELLRNNELDVRVLLLVRDPRATIQSRKHRSWCMETPSCMDPTALCADLVSDYHDARKLSQLFPARVRVMRYEDLSFNLDRMTREIFDFFRLSYVREVQRFLQTHTKRTRGGVSSTFRDSKTAPVHWIKDLSYLEIDAIQSKCHRAMELFGYRLAHSAENLQLLDPLKNFTFPA